VSGQLFNILSVSIAKESSLVYSVNLLKVRHRLAEVDVNAPVVNEDVIHLQVCSFTRRDGFELNESVAQTVLSLMISDNFAA